MKTLSKILVLFVTIIICTSSCKHEKPTVPTEVSGKILNKIKALGYSSEYVLRVNKGYVVEGDIFLSDQYLNSQTNNTSNRIASSEQYSTNSIVAFSTTRNITISITNLGYPYVDALDTAILRFNNLSLGLTFSRVSSGADINVDSMYRAPSGSGILTGYAGFPSSGNPFNLIKMNTHPSAFSWHPTPVLYAATILQHEIGHCIGFRHSDLTDLSFSCGGSPVAEVASPDPGALVIAGTPAAPDPWSWMLACNMTGSDRTFNLHDVHALRTLYPNPAVSAIELSPFGGLLNVCTNGSNYTLTLNNLPIGSTIYWWTRAGSKIVGSNTGSSVDVTYDSVTHDGSGWSFIYAEVYTPLGHRTLPKRLKLKTDCL